MHNIKPELWGSHAWDLFHYITLAYPDNPTYNDKINTSKFFDSVKYILPCEKCRVEFINVFENNPLTNIVLSTRKNLINWLINIHDKINKNINNSSFTHEMFVNKYINHNQTNFNEYIVFIIIILFIIFILYYIYNFV